MWYVIRCGWNAANQSSMERTENPQDKFESGRYMLVGIIDAETKEEACAKCNATVYQNQYLIAVRNQRSIRGLTREIRAFA